MLLTRPQKALIELLDQYGALKLEQAEKLLTLRADYGTLRMEPMIRQLEYGGYLRKEQNVIIRLGKSADPSLIESLDIMLLLAPHRFEIDLHQRGRPPFSLTFFKTKDARLYRYDICPVPAGKESMVGAQLEGLICKYRVLVFILVDLKQRECLNLHGDCCYAIRENGSYRFYKPEE